MNENEELQSGFPDWLTEDYKLMEPVFCQAFLREHPMRYIRGRFYTVDGPVADESSLKQKIYEEISPWLETKIARKVDLSESLLRTKYGSSPSTHSFAENTSALFSMRSAAAFACCAVQSGRLSLTEITLRRSEERRVGKECRL